MGTLLAHRRGNERGSMWNEAKVGEAVSHGRYLNIVNIIDELPRPEAVRVALDNKIGICRDRSPRIILVEVIGDYVVFIAIPDGKSDCDFMVWRCSPKLEPQLKIPTHGDLGKVFLELKKRHKRIDEFLINATIKLLKDRLSVNKIIQRYFKDLDDTLKSESKKFLITLKMDRVT
jgi:hypothetical protein